MEIPTLESRVASLSLGGHVGWQRHIEIALSESSTCSSPTSEASDFDHMSNDEADWMDSIEVDASLPRSALVEQVISSLPTTGERPLLEHLFWDPVTLADIEALVPAVIKSSDIMYQLVVNIGCYNAYGLISPHDLERILIHLLAVGDDQNHLYETTKARIELERRRRQHLEYLDCQKRVKGSRKVDIVINSVHNGETIGDFSRSRLHNGPGLTDRKRSNVRLPQNDTRQASAIPNLLMLEIDMRVEHDRKWATSKSSPDILLEEKEEGEIVVKLPPKETAPLA